MLNCSMSHTAVEVGLQVPTPSPVEHATVLYRLPTLPHEDLFVLTPST